MSVPLGPLLHAFRVGESWNVAGGRGEEEGAARWGGWGDGRVERTAVGNHEEARSEEGPFLDHASPQSKRGRFRADLGVCAKPQYDFPVAKAYLATLEGVAKPKVVLSEEDIMNGVTEADVIARSKLEADKDGDDVPMRPEEKRRLHWKGKPYLVRLSSFPSSSLPDN